MALMQVHFFSEALTECNSMNVILPVEKNGRNAYPVLWLLPPAGGDHTAWQRNTSVEQLAEKLGVMVVMPDMKLSYGLDMVHGFRYFKMLTEELPEMAAEFFPVDREAQMIAGAKEGAHAAMMAALRFPDRYRAAAAFSGGSMTDEMPEERERRQFEHAFGTSDTESLRNGEFALSRWLEGIEEESPRFYLAYSERDVYGKSARLLGDGLEKRAGNHLSLEIQENPMGWREWLEALEKMLVTEIGLPDSQT